jgi:hypothetical protein
MYTDPGNYQFHEHIPFFLEVTMVKPSLLIFETSIDVKPMIEPNFNVDWHLVSLGLTKQSFIVQQSRRGHTE